MSLPNIIIIVIDSLRYDFSHSLRLLNSYGFIDNIAISPATWTLPSHISLLTGLYPSIHGIQEQDVDTVLARKARIIMKLRHYGVLGWLKNIGYNTYIITANPYLTKYFGFKADHMFFVRYDDISSRTFEAWESVDQSIARTMLKLLKRPRIFTSATLRYVSMKILAEFPKFHKPMKPRDKGYQKIFAILNYNYNIIKEPFFMLINLMEAHAPYTYPEWRIGISYLVPKITKEIKCRGVVPEWGIKIWRNAYPDHARYATERALELALKFMDKAYIIVTSDHGEQLEDGLFHGLTLDDQLVKVPFFTNIPVEIQGAISLTHIPSLIKQLIKEKHAKIGEEEVKAEFHETEKKKPCGRNIKLVKVYKRSEL